METAWETVREAVLGSNRDFTKGSIGRAIFMLSVPMVLEMMMESLFGIVDVYFVAHLGPEAVTVVGLTESQLTVVFGIAMGLSMATAAVVARRTGEQNPEGAASAAVQGLGLTLAVALGLGLFGATMGPTLLAMMGAGPAILAQGSLYSRIVLGSSGVILLLFVINAVFRGAGDAAASMRVLWLANGINILLDPCLIRGLGPFPRLGVLGAAVATLTGRSIGVLYQCWILFGSGKRIKIRLAHLRFEPEVMWPILRMALSGMGQYLVAMASWMGIMRIMSTFGSVAIAGYTIAIRIVIFSILPSWGMANAAATLVGQNLGAGQPERAEQSVWRAGSYNAMFMGGISLVFLLSADLMMRFFTDDVEVVRVGARTLRILCVDYVLWAFGMVIVQAFNGAGDTTTPTIINLCIYWLLQLPLAYTLSTYLGYGPTGTAIAIAFADGCLALVSIAIFRKGRWKLQRV